MFTENLRQHSKAISHAGSARWSSFLKQELPTKKLEEWKYTDLTFLDKQNFSTDFEHKFINVVSDNTFSFSVRRAEAQAPLPQVVGLQMVRGLEDLQKVLNQTSGFRPWSYSNYFSDLFELTNPQQLYFIFDSKWDSKNVLHLELATLMDTAVLSSLGLNIIVLPGVNVCLHEVFKSHPEAVINANINYYLAENAQLSLFRLDSASKARVVSTLRARVEKNARFHSVHFTGDALWSRHNSYVELSGEGAHGELSASYLGDEGHFVDHHTFMDHKVGFTTSNQEFSGVLASKSVGVYNGKVWIQRDAQKSNAEQLSRNLLLSKNAEANTKPELLIDADDVKAKHGATIGQMDQEELFYMQSRGLSPELAREMVLKSFVFASADKLPEVLREIYHLKVTAEVARFIADLKNV